MYSQLAKSDIENMRKLGYCPTDDEIIRLNDLAKRIECGRDPSVCNAPRVAFAGNITINEPTVASIIWWLECGKDAFDDDKRRFYTYIYSLVYARDLDRLSVQSRDDIRRAVKAWVKTVCATEGEIWRALLYVKDALDMDDAKPDKVDDDEISNRMWQNVIACAGAMSLSPDDLKTLTQSQLVALLIKANQYHRLPIKQSVAKDYIEYRLLMKAIEDRGNNNG